MNAGHTPLLPWFFVVALILLYAALSAARSLFAAGRLCRPVFCGLLLWGWSVFFLPEFSGVILALTLFYELIFLDLLYAGTYVPPQSLFCFLSALAAAVFFDLRAPQSLAFVMALSLPGAYIGSALEQRQRRRQDKWHDGLTRAISSRESLEAVSNRALRYSALHPLIFFGLVFGLFSGLLLLFLQIWLDFFGKLPVIKWVSWHYLWAFGAVGGMLALRIRWSFAIFAAGAGLFGVMFAL